MVITALAVINSSAVSGTLYGNSQPVMLTVNWGAIGKDVGTIVGAGLAIALLPEITVPALIGAYIATATSGFDLGYNRCNYGINWGC